MKLRSLPGAPLRWSLVLALMFVTAMSALAQFDTLSDEDRCFLGQLAYCPNAPQEETSEKAEKAEEESGEKETVSVEREIASTCPYLPPHVAVFGFNVNTQCQMVNVAGIAQFDVLQSNFVDAVDVWGVVPQGVEVCFHNAGFLVFLDANHAPRTLHNMETYEREGMTCGEISGHGTVVQLDSLAPMEPTPAEEASAAQPITKEVAAEKCLIKLTETVYLRAEPDGEIFGLVWINSEVPVIETIGLWHKVVFQGQTGYVSRLYRTVLRGDCE